MGTLRRRLPPLNWLVTFEAAGRHGNFSHAAEELASTQSAVSRQIKQLEAFYGVQLFERRHRDVVLTEPGQFLSATVTATLIEIAQASDRVRTMRGAPNVFRIRIDDSQATFAIIPHIEELEQKFPKLQLDVMITSSPLDLPLDTFDICFYTEPGTVVRYGRMPICDDWIFPVCSPAFAETLPSPCTAEDLRKANLLHYRNPQRRWTTWRDFLLEFGIDAPEADKGPMFSQYTSCFDAAESGAGIAIAWFTQAKARLDAGRLVRVSELCMHLPDAFLIFTDPHKRAHPATPAVIEFFRERLTLSLAADSYRVR